MSLARLTTKAAAKFSDMNDNVEEAQNRVLSLQRRISETQKQIRNLNRENNAAAIEAYEREIERLSLRRDDEQHSYLSQARILTAVRTWLMQLPLSIELRDTEAKFYASDEKDLLGAVDRCHADIVKLNFERAHVARAVLPIEVLHEQADAHVDALAARGRPTLAVDGDQLVVKHSIDGFGVNSADAVTFMAWLHPDAMKARLRADIDAMRAEQRNLPVMTRAERKAKLAELDARIMALSREEEFYICEALSEGTTIPRRDNALPEAVLGVEVVRVDAATREKRRQDDARAAQAKSAVA